mmetsp:Transcript_46143/g.111844  ORF Transcript_46143/g.111844 Transcript_46143/m.111844 type:complete len:244 (-) Transcript_46143:1763-2494(-)
MLFRELVLIVRGVGGQVGCIVMFRFIIQGPFRRRTTRHGLGASTKLVDGEPVGSEFSLAFSRHLVFTQLEPMILSRLDEIIGRFLGNVNPITFASRLDTRSRIHGISKQLKACLVTTQHPRRDWSTVQSKTHGQFGSIWTQRDFQFLDQIVHANATITGKPCHDEGMVDTGIGQSRHGDITISDRFHFEDASSSGNFIKGIIHSLQKSKDLSRFSHTGPGGKSHEVGKHDGGFGKEIGNGFSS